MELTERERSRKSRSFKRVNEDYQDDNHSDSSNENTGRAHDVLSVTGDVCEGLKKQVSGMRCLLNNKVNSIGIHQPLMPGREKLKVELGASDLTWLQHNTHQTNVRLDEPHSSQSIVWKDIQVPTQNSCVSGRYSGEDSRSSKPVIDAITERLQGMPESNGRSYSTLGSNCCMCSCQPTLLAILQELRTLRELMQGQAGPQGTMHVPLSHSNNFRSSLLRTKIIKKRLIHRNKPAAAQANPKIHNPDISLPQTERNRSIPTKRLTTENNPRQAPPNGVEGYISELDSRQNSDLFKIDRLPGPTDWIQILQDQIARARNRLKRGAVLQPFESSGKMGSNFLLNTGASTNTASSSDRWDASEPVCTVQM
ncbi:hypothetical protein scyTo_0006670 [Scyliorhinus torazame]|uniref:BEN domain-containing protein n=1 Tax=Scyliorhinus torazame TaxID=75743 RepID=A0A401PJ91_SCYTO|nr:hypothetical protein [Scyliorhinus torazame]